MTLIRPATKLAGDTVKRVGHRWAVVFWTALAPSGYPPVKKFGSFLEVLCSPHQCLSHCLTLQWGKPRHAIRP